MRALCFRSVESVAVDSLPDPTIEDARDAIVEVDVAGLCGSDLHPYFGREVGLEPGTVMGHEFVGRIVEIGQGVEKLQIGDRVGGAFTTNCGKCYYCRTGLTSRCSEGQLFGWRENGQGLHGGQAELVRVPLADGTLMRLSSELDATTALLLGDNLSTGYFGASMCVQERSAPSDVIAVVGCGTVGLLAIASARQMGVQQLLAIDPNPSRLAIAEQLGAIVFTDAHPAVAEARLRTEGRGVDGVMEFVGLPEAQKLAYELVRPGGRMSVIGCHCTPNFSFSPADAYDKNLTYRTGRCPARHYMDVLLDRLADSPIDLSWCITHRFGIEDAVEAYEIFANRRDGCVKAVLEFNR